MLLVAIGRPSKSPLKGDFLLELGTRCVVLLAIADDDELSVLDGFEGLGVEGGVGDSRGSA